MAREQYLKGRGKERQVQDEPGTERRHAIVGSIEIYGVRKPAATHCTRQDNIRAVCTTINPETLPHDAIFIRVNQCRNFCAAL
jgi:hypothetical protein